MMTEKEEQAIQLKSEIIICKQKAKQYKEQMLQQQKHFETENQAHLAVKIVDAKKEYVKEMESVKE
jgi:hypothetical protein